MILIIDNYDSFTYNLYQLVAEFGAAVRVVRNDELSIDQIRELKPSGIILSPGPGHPKDAGVTVDVLLELGASIPVLGVCLGHQAIAQAFGGQVVSAPRLMHGKSSVVTHDKLGIFAQSESPMQVGRYHSLMIATETIPDCLQVTSQTEDGLIMGVRHRQLPIEGVQFHPESVLTPNGQNLIKQFLLQTGELVA